MEKKSRNRLIIVTIIILVIVGALVAYSLMSGSGSYSYYKTVKELRQDPSLVGVSVRVGGKVEKGSLKQDKDGHHFKIVQGKESIKVNYEGVLPQTFKEGILVIAEGKYKKGYQVDATKIITKCPTKYKAKAKKGT